MRRNSSLLPRSRRGAILVGAFGGGTMIGKLGGNVFQRSPFGNVVRQFVKPVNPNSTRQVDVRVVLDALSFAWSTTLTQSQRDGWIDYARNTPIVNKTGAPQFLNGRQMFIRTEFILEFVQGPFAYLGTPPTTPGINNVKVPALTYTAATGALVLTAVAAGQPVGWISIFLVSRNLSPSRNFWKGPFNFTTSRTDASVLPSTLTTVPGPVAVGDKVFVQVRTFDQIRNKTSQPFIFQVVAV